jgi:hypothetical protein
MKPTINQPYKRLFGQSRRWTRDHIRQPTERELVNEFPDTFKQVFDDDGGHSKAMIKDGTLAPSLISGDRTFPNLGVEDNWDNEAKRGDLLQSSHERVP